MPGANARALEKACSIDCDGIIIDLEDAVAPDLKVEARGRAADVVKEHPYGYREVAVRVNGMTPSGMPTISLPQLLPGQTPSRFPKSARLSKCEQ